MSDTGDALLRAVLANPAEDTPRLVYADWLQEIGHEERAEFIRVQVELAARAAKRGRVLAGEEYEPAEGAAPARELLARERELLGPGGTDSAFVLLGLGWLPPGTGIETSRGFVDLVILPAADWLRHADALLAAHPVRKVVLTTYPEVGWSEHYGWPGQGRHCYFRQLPDKPMLWVRHLRVPDAATPRVTSALLENYWPGVAFELPMDSLLAAAY